MSAELFLFKAAMCFIGAALLCIIPVMVLAACLMCKDFYKWLRSKDEL